MSITSTPIPATPTPVAVEERARNYPLSRWYCRPWADVSARKLQFSLLRPWHVTLAGLLVSLLGGGLLWLAPSYAFASGGLLWLSWFCDRLDGQLARRQGTASRWGGWFDANCDELADLFWHAALAGGLAALGNSRGWWWFAAFVSGKYLLMYGLNFEESLRHKSEKELISPNPSGRAKNSTTYYSFGERFLRALYHLPGNADVRLHLLLLAVCTGYWELGLAWVAVYYHARWMVRHVLVMRRLQKEVA